MTGRHSLVLARKLLGDTAVCKYSVEWSDVDAQEVHTREIGRRTGTGIVWLVEGESWESALEELRRHLAEEKPPSPSDVARQRAQRALDRWGAQARR